MINFYHFLHTHFEYFEYLRYGIITLTDERSHLYNNLFLKEPKQGWKFCVFPLGFNLKTSATNSYLHRKPGERNTELDAIISNSASISCVTRGKSLAISEHQSPPLSNTNDHIFTLPNSQAFLSVLNERTNGKALWEQKAHRLYYLNVRYYFKFCIKGKKVICQHSFTGLLFFKNKHIHKTKTSTHFIFSWSFWAGD